TIAFGYEMNTLNTPNDIIQQHLEKIFPMISARMSAPIPLWRYIKFEKDKELEKSLKVIRKTILDFIDKAKQRLQNPKLKENPSNFLEALLVEQETKGNFTDKEIYGNVLTMLLAGEDTTSNSISWAIYFLAQQPEIVQKIRVEVQSVSHDGSFPDNYDLIKKLHYTEAVVLETLRIKPVAPDQYFEAIEDTVIQDIQFRKGEVVILENKVAQTSENNFFSPDTFIPERWLKSACPFSGNHKPKVIHSFGAGPRFCPGKNLAMQEMIMALGMICLNFDIHLEVQPEDVKEVFAFTMYPDNLKISLKKVK
ncbi:MAG: cytochrome P450, partial [Flavobacteriaceae bacterium]|nr:cytochrome P450 [Flavobacteriaceae bacterium]